MRRDTKYNLLYIERNDIWYRTPEHWKENNDAIIENLERIDQELIELRQRIDRLERLSRGSEWD